MITRGGVVIIDAAAISLDFHIIFNTIPHN